MFDRGMIAGTVAVGHHPAMLAAIEIDGRDPSVWRFEQRKTTGPADPLSPALRVPQIRLLRIARYDIGDKGRRNRWNVERSGVGIERRALPVRPADGAGQLDCSLLRVRATASN